MAIRDVRSCGNRPLLLLCFVLLVPFAACGDDADDPGGATGDDALAEVVTERIGTYEHRLGHIEYGRPLPSGGDHAPPPYWLTCGVYEGEVPPELAVHSLEHGAVWIGLGPDATADDRAAAAELARGRKVIVSDVPGLDAPVELVAWGKRLTLESADDPRAEAFVGAFLDASGAPEPGASCTSLGDPPTPPVLPET